MVAQLVLLRDFRQASGWPDGAHLVKRTLQGFREIITERRPLIRIAEQRRRPHEPRYNRCRRANGTRPAPHKQRCSRRRRSLYPFRAPISNPLTKYRCRNGYTRMIGPIVTAIVAAFTVSGEHRPDRVGAVHERGVLQRPPRPKPPHRRPLGDSGGRPAIPRRSARAPAALRRRVHQHRHAWRGSSLTRRTGTTPPRGNPDLP